MSNSDAPRDEEAAWVDDVQGRTPPAAKEDAETYAIAGGVKGWDLRDVLDESRRKAADAVEVTSTPARNEPRASLAPTSIRRRSRKNSWGDFAALMGFNALVFVGSICVMMLELTASRLIAKHVGSSLYTWTSVIGVVLAGITVGNYLGGWIADRFERARALAWMFLLASLSCASVLWLDQLASRLSRPDGFSWPTWVLCIVGMIFFLPSLLLGTTSPIVASMAIERSQRVGNTVGNVYAWGAFGSIVGTFLTGFYLIDVWGTRSIIGLTSAILALLAVFVAGGRRAFRTGVVVGWLQFLALLLAAATLTSPTATAVGGWWGESIPRFRSTSKAEKIAAWRAFGGSLGLKLHELGLLLKLRDDQTIGYYDESSYSYIEVGDDQVDGASVRYLRLDKLIHSYFNPDNPTELHYEYEDVYAAVTRQAAPKPEANASVRIPEFPEWERVVGQLPEGVSFDASTRQLTIASLSPALVDRLASLSPDVEFATAVDRLHEESIKPNWGGFSTATLASLPPGVDIPESLRDIVRFDPRLEVISAYDVVTRDVRDRLLKLSPQAPWRAALADLKQRSAPISTLFLGGGGFIFPRWILAEFPGATHVHVAELDPAVYEAVRHELGYTPSDEERIKTSIGDARNYVDDRLQANAKLIAQGQPPVLYDFIYGDAFNDFSPPWHLTTREFTQKVHDLLTPTGALLANIIEIYPRTKAPEGTAKEALVSISFTPTDKLFGPPIAGKMVEVATKYAPLKYVSGSQLSYAGPMSGDAAARLKQLDPRNLEWTSAIDLLAERSREPALMTTLLPQALRPTPAPERSWTQCPGVPGVDVYRIGDYYALGVRGAVSPALEEKLVQADPTNAEWVRHVRDAARRSRKPDAGRFLGRYVRTMTEIFPHISVFSTSDSIPSDDRDTFVVVCSRTPLDLSNLDTINTWTITPFATFDQSDRAQPPTLGGQMESLLELAQGQVLTDDFAPVETLLRPVFARQDD